MLKKVVAILVLTITSHSAFSENVIIKTSMGDITAELFEEKSPISVKNFLAYVDSGFYNNVIFHRVINNFMIQTGGFDETMTEKPTLAPIVNESNNYVRNERGTLAMARTSNPNSATSQFYINHNKNSSLDYRFGKPGYAVFGKITSGMEIVDKIAKVETRRIGAHGDVPVKPVTIKQIVRATAE